jgi:hypothetical protein
VEHRKIVRLPLTPEQHKLLSPYINEKYGDNPRACIFIVVASELDLTRGVPTAIMQAICLPWMDAKKAINFMRKILGMVPIPSSKKRKPASEQPTRTDSKTES